MGSIWPSASKNGQSITTTIFYPAAERWNLDHQLEVSESHASIDRRHGFIRGWNVTVASAYDGALLCYMLDKHGYFSDIHHKKPKGRPMSEATSRANGRRSKIRAFVGRVFAQQKSRVGLFMRTIGIARARTKIGMANLAYILTRYVWHQGRTAPA